jgi:hypothetical protein
MTATAFARNYNAARALFREAAAAAGAELDTYVSPAVGPAGGELATDTAWLGPREADAVLVIMSGTHGVEGFCGSGAQVDFLRRNEIANYPAGTAVLLLHAVNPYGFAWLRRVNEDNVDLNRNWIDFDEVLPANAEYDMLRKAICPSIWTPDSPLMQDRVLSDYARCHGFAGLQSAISSGQWADPTGVFYGGKSPTWSRRTQAAIFDRHLMDRRRVTILDLHTGLGPPGFCERILTTPAGSPANRLAADWFGAGLASPAAGTSSSATIKGDGLSHAVGNLAARGVEVVALALEYGTVPIIAMLDAVRADAWLHVHGDVSSPVGSLIKTQLRDAFYVDDDIWRGMVIGQFLLSARQAAMAMSR